METDPRLKILYSAARDAKNHDARRLIISFRLSKEERCDWLCHAVVDKKKKVAEWILYNGFLRSKNKTKQTLKASTANRAKSELIKTLMKRITKANDFPATKFMDLAISEGDDKLVSLLLRKGASVRSKVSSRFTAIQSAVRRGHSKIAEILLAEKADVNSMFKGSTLLHTATFKGNDEMVALLLRSGARVDAKRPDGSTALHTAVEKGFTRVVERLLGYGADVKACYGTKPPLHLANQAEMPELSLKSDDLKSRCPYGLNRLYSTVRDGKIHDARKLIVSLKLSKEERCDWFCRAVIDSQKKVAQLILYGGFLLSTNDSQSTQKGSAADKAKSELIETLTKKVAKANAFPATHFMNLAINEGNSKLVSLLLGKGADVHTKVSGAFTALQLAAIKGQSDIVKNLRAKKSFCNSTYKGSALLHTAVLRGDKNTVPLPLEFGAHINATPYNGSTALFIAAEKGFLEIAEKLIDAGANVRDRIIGIAEIDPPKEQFCAYLNNIIDSGSVFEPVKNECMKNWHFDNVGWTPLHAAAEKGHQKVVELFLRKDAELDAFDDFHRTPLYMAALKCHEETVELLRGHGAEFNSRDEAGQTPLHYFAIGGCLESAKIALINGANIEATNSMGQTPLYLAMEVRNAEMVTFLLKEGAVPTNCYHDTRLHAAVRRGSIEDVRFLLRYGIDIESVTKKGETALHVAVYKGHEFMLRFLLEHGANVDAVRNDDGKSALIIAVEMTDLNCINTLLEFGANVDLKDWGYNESSALHSAASYGFFGIVELLLIHGANTEMRDKDGATPLFSAVAEASGHSINCGLRLYDGWERSDCFKVINILLKYSADIHALNRWERTPLDIAASEVVDPAPAALETILEYGGADIHVVPENHAYKLLDEVSLELNTMRRKDGTNTTAETLVRHVIKMKAANLYVSKEKFVVKKFSNQNLLEVFQKECEAEVTKMKREEILKTGLTLYDILIKRVFEMAVILKDPSHEESIIQVLNSSDYKNRFPIYGSSLLNQLEKGTIRKELLEKGVKICHLMFNRIHALPYDITERIAVRYLDNKDLRNLIKFKTRSNPTLKRKN